MNTASNPKVPLASESIDVEPVMSLEAGAQYDAAVEEWRKSPGDQNAKNAAIDAIMEAAYAMNLSEAFFNETNRSCALESLGNAARKFDEQRDRNGRRVNGGRGAMIESLQAAIYMLSGLPSVSSDMMAPLVILKNALTDLERGQTHPALERLRPVHGSGNSRSWDERHLLWWVLHTSDALVELGLSRAEADQRCADAAKGAASLLSLSFDRPKKVADIRANWFGRGKPWDGHAIVFHPSDLDDRQQAQMRRLGRLRCLANEIVERMQR